MLINGNLKYITLSGGITPMRDPREGGGGTGPFSEYEQVLKPLVRPNNL